MKKVWGNLFKVAISLGLIIFFLQRVEWQEIQIAIGSANRILFFISVLLFFISNILGALQWRVLLGMQNIRFPFKEVVLLYFVGVFFNNFMVGNIGGDAVRVYDLNRLTGKGAAGFAATFLDRFMGLIVLIFFSLTAFVLSPHLWKPKIGLPILVLGLGLLAIIIFGFSRRLSGLMLEKLREKIPIRFVIILEEIRKAFILYRKAYIVLLHAGLIAVGVQCCRVGVYYVVGQALGQDVEFKNFFLFIPLIAMVAAVPVSFGGIGVRENIGALLFGQVGLAPEITLIMMFLGYLSGILASLVGGFYFVLRRTENKTG